MSSYLLKEATVVNENKQIVCDVFVKNGFIERLGQNLSVYENHQEINLSGKLLLPGLIDDQVHFREPGLTNKGTIFSESRAAVAGGITSYMEMPNTVPSAVTIDLLEEKYQIASTSSMANYSFYIGSTNNNIEEIKQINPQTICGVKIFMGSSTGDMLVDNPDSLEAIFKYAPTIITTHCEDDPMIKKNLEFYLKEFGEEIPPKFHPIIRNEESCYKSSSFAVSLAKKYQSKLHILHISTAKELELFSNDIPLSHKHITAEACIHHLWFSDEDYEKFGNFIKWNPAIKSVSDREAIFQAVLDNRIDVVATDHAPHTLDEKNQRYLKAPSGGPLVQHALQAMLEKMEQGLISLEKIVEKMAHSPAELFKINQRGFIREGYFADLVVIDKKAFTVSKDNLLYKCGWSPFDGITFNHSIDKTFVNGNLVFSDGEIIENGKGSRLTFNR